MATDNTAALIQTLLPLVLGKKETQTKSVPGDVTANFNNIMQGLMPNVQNSAVTQQDLDALFQSIFAKGQKAFAPNMALQAGAGGYNSTGVEALKNDAMAKATSESIQAMLTAKLQGNQQQTQAAQVAGQLASNQGQLTGTMTAETPALLGDAAGPAMAYALYKMFTGNDGTGAAANAAGKAGGAAQANAASSVNAGQDIVFPSIDATSSIAPVAAAPALSNAGKLSEFGDESGAAFDAAGGMGDIDYSLAFASPSLATGASSLSGFGNVGELAGAGSSAGAIDVAGAAGALGEGAGMYDIATGSAGISAGLGSGGATSALTDVTGATSVMSQMGANISNIDWLSPTAGQWGGLALGAIGALQDGKVTGEEVGTVAGGYGGAKLGAAAGSAFGPVGTVVGGLLGSIIGSKAMNKMCYITTATMEGTGNSDDNSYELATMRKFRDEFMAATPVGQELIQDYYDKAPAVVAAINKRDDAKQLYSAIYAGYLAPAIKAIEAGDNYRALTIYREMSQAAEQFAWFDHYHSYAKG